MKRGNRTCGEKDKKTKLICTEPYLRASVRKDDKVHDAKHHVARGMNGQILGAWPVK